MDLRTDLLRIGIEGRHDAETVALELLIAHEGGAQVPCPDEHRVVVLIPSEISLDGLDELLDRVSLLGLADDARDGEILPHLDRLEVELSGDDGPRNIEIVVPFGLSDYMEIGRQASHRRSVRYLDFGHGHSIRKTLYLNR